MSDSFDFDISGIVEELEKLENVNKYVYEGAAKGLERAGTIWRNKAYRNAPYDTGNLVDGISDVDVTGETVGTLVGEFGVEAWSKWRGKPFNYAYYIHEIKGKGGVPDPFVTDSYPQVKSRMKNAVTSEIAKSLKEAGY